MSNVNPLRQPTKSHPRANLPMEPDYDQVPSGRSDVRRVTKMPTDKAADGFVNLYVEDLDGVRHAIKTVIPLHEGFGRAVDEAMLARIRKYNDDLATYNQVKDVPGASDMEKPEPPVFKFVADVVLVAPKAPPRF